MKNKKLSAVTIGLIAIVFLIARFLHAPEVRGGSYKNAVYVSKVIDGDTIELSNGERVRYIGIDTPEVRTKQGSNWIYNPMPYAEIAKDFNRQLVEGKSVRLEFDVQRRDRYNRLLAYVYVDDKMVNLEMVRHGYAMIYTYPPNVKYVEKLLDAQREARKNDSGLWGNVEEDIISSLEAKDNIGSVKMVETKVIDTYLTDKVLILNCGDNFKVVIFSQNFELFPKMSIRSPDTHFKYENIRVYGIIKKYKGSSEIVVYDPSQLEILH